MYSAADVLTFPITCDMEGRCAKSKSEWPKARANGRKQAEVLVECHVRNELKRCVHLVLHKLVVITLYESAKQKNDFAAAAGRPRFTAETTSDIPYSSDHR
jgi:hypothetical protein